MNLADLIQDMLDRGMPDAAVAVARAFELGLSANRPAVPERSKAALRTQKWRERKDAETSQNVTCDVTETQESVSPTPPSKEIPSSKENPPKGGQKKGSPLPADWQPSPSARQILRERGLTEAQIDEQAEALRNWGGANRNRAIARKADWNLAFIGWGKRWADERKIQRPSLAAPTLTEPIHRYATREEAQAAWDARYDRLLAEEANQ